MSESAPRPPKVMALTLRVRDRDEHLLRRLGQALVLQWDEVPNELQDVLIDQAAVVHDREEAPHGPEDIETFVRSVKTMALPE